MTNIAPSATGFGASEDQARRVLVADEDACLRDIYATLLGFHGSETVAVATGAEALQRARELRPDAVVLDMDVPDVDGLEVTRLLQQDAATAGTPVILLSVHSRMLARLQARGAGSRGYLEKPFAPRDLLEEVRRVIGAGGGPSASA
jgi:two-component system OmpR family response regulator